MPAGPLAHAPAFGEGSDDASKSVFQADEFCRAGVDVVAEDAGILQVLECEVVAVGWNNSFNESAAEGGDAACFPFEDVAAVVGDDAVGRGCEVGADGDLVAHCAGADEEGGFLAGQVGDEGFEGVCSGVCAAVHHVVEEGGAGDCGEHARGRRGDDVACKQPRGSESGSAIGRAKEADMDILRKSNAAGPG